MEHYEQEPFKVGDKVETTYSRGYLPGVVTEAKGMMIQVEMPTTSGEAYTSYHVCMDVFKLESIVHQEAKLKHIEGRERSLWLAKLDTDKKLADLKGENECASI